MGLIACYSVVVLVMSAFDTGRQSVIFTYLAKYTMSIFLMHTLFAALLRVGLFKMGIRNAVVHVTLGLSISFIGPIIAASIMKKANGWSFSFIQ